MFSSEYTLWILLSLVLVTLLIAIACGRFSKPSTSSEADIDALVRSYTQEYDHYSPEPTVKEKIAGWFSNLASNKDAYTLETGRGTALVETGEYDESGSPILIVERDLASWKANRERDKAALEVLKEDSKEVPYTGLYTIDEDAEQTHGFWPTNAAPTINLGANVSRASYELLRRYLALNAPIPKGIIRAEELMNAVHYDLAEPKEGETFAVSGEIAPCPWNEAHKILRIALATPLLSAEERLPFNYVFLIDTSYKMIRHSALLKLKKALYPFIQQMGPHDIISILSFENTANVIFEGGRHADRASLIEAVHKLPLGEFRKEIVGLEKAYEIAEKYFIEGANNRIIVGTAGDLGLSKENAKQWAEKAKTKQEKGIALTLLNLGNDMENHAKRIPAPQNGKSNFYDLSNLEMTKHVITQTLHHVPIVVAEEVEIQVELSPEKLEAFRLVGYEKQISAPLAHHDSVAQSGIVVAGHQLTLLYELIEIPQPKTDDSVAENWLNVHVQYKEPGSQKPLKRIYPMDNSIQTDTLSENMQRATMTAQIAMILNDTPERGTLTFKELYQLASRSFTFRSQNEEWKRIFRSLSDKY